MWAVSLVKIPFVFPINNKIFLFFLHFVEFPVVSFLPSLCDSETRGHENSLERLFGSESGGDNPWHGMVDCGWIRGLGFKSLCWKGE